ncbi:hypothetical protein GLOIN_2v1482355 [Rhizophagus irregularis DAOM 181602=DAOM 197198]|uniref:F-box domain-containing protein n=1 Tax=Rhizophagus irregularis (strain DAOM 181602 / DAOM 197198 / MUCL 43194) TaxID=747089 RepID=A0A2P4PM31_RHIID|nr:hypothetical protein GLOIN_2v1482355 [Rhizophagus irregularis DAOM 181602=DAOM 197198]POG66417.1 hypothetical protein GLOIN_2v1482355 [Rhizophagus irregularis DAOM 181602=DAOM 197198]|eukprot:XP_025173283.1 hypothetical protein GLOIN_2v1482355 [Rhizophagus irregularis DAOM 181602=DAOM 197198]
MASSKVLDGDLPEITSFILRNLRNDIKSLHSCILVNRFWCRIAIPLLWENPFSINLNKTNSHFLDIYLSSFHDDNNVLEELEINRINNTRLSSFNYPSYIRTVDTHKIEMTIREWILNFTTLANETDETDETNETNETNEINETVDNNSIQTSQQSIIPRPLTISPELAISISTLAESAQSLVHAALSAIFNLNKPDSPKVKNAIQRIYTEIFKLFIESGATLSTFHLNIDNLNSAIFNDIYKLFLNNPQFISDIKNFTFGFRKNPFPLKIKTLAIMGCEIDNDDFDNTFFDPLFKKIDSNDLNLFFQNSNHVKFEKFLLRTRNNDVDPILNVLQDFIKNNDNLKYIAYEKGSINSIDDEICYKGLEDRIRECGSSVKVEKYNDIRIDTNYI